MDLNEKAIIERLQEVTSGNEEAQDLLDALKNSAGTASGSEARKP